MPITESDLAALRDASVVSASGEKIGSIGQIYLDDQTGEPTFVTANTGLFGLSQSFVPLQGARVQEGDLVVNYDKETVKDAPRIDDDGSLSPEEEDELYAYYGLGGAGTTTDGYDTRTTGTTGETGTTTATGTTTDTGYTGTLASDTRTATAPDYDTDTAADDRRTVTDDTRTTTGAGYDRGTATDDTRTTTGAGYDRGTATDDTRTTTADTGTAVGDSTLDQGADRPAEDLPGAGDAYRESGQGRVGSDDTITRSDEEESVSTQPRETGRARLRKYVVTESVTIPVQREEVRLEQEPMTGGTGTDESTGSEDVRRDEVGSGFGQDRPDRRDI
jgi:hypothetical protein